MSPAPTTERLQSIQRMVADQMGDKLPDFEADALRAIPVQAGGLYPISDVWYIGLAWTYRIGCASHRAVRARIAEEAAVGRSGRAQRRRHRLRLRHPPWPARACRRSLGRC